MEITKKPRSSNLELCRIICMFLIIMHHCVIHGGAIGMDVCSNKYISLFILPGGKICFNAFIALSMWFLVDSEFKTQRFIKTWIQVLFYSILFTFIAYCFGSDISFRNWISIFFPITGNSHGFASAYLAFYLLLPFLSKISKDITKKENIRIVVLLFIFQIFSQMMGTFAQYYQHLFSELTLFIFCYFSLLLLKRNRFNFLNRKAFLFFIFFVIWTLIWLVRCAQVFYPNSQIFGYLISITGDESSILNIIGGFSLFFLFLSLNIKTNKIINAIATTTFGILLIHDHNFFRYILWPKIFHTSSWFYSKHFTFLVILSSIAVFMVCMSIDFIRNFIFEKIYKKINLFRKIKTNLMDVSVSLVNNPKDISNTKNNNSHNEKNTFKNSKKIKLFCIISLFLFFIFLLLLIFTRGKLANSFLANDIFDSFMDFGNSMDHTIYRDPYSIDSIYPPLCYMIFLGFLHLIPQQQAVNAISQRGLGYYGIKMLQAPMLYIILFIILSVILIIVATKYLLNEKNNKIKILFSIMICFSIPFIFAYERGNIILISLLFSLFFFCFKDSKNLILREFSLISLALSAAIKIYPAIFGLLLIKEKRIKDSIRLLIYGLLTFFSPFLFFKNGLYNVIILIKNITATSIEFGATREAYKLNFTSILKFFFEKFGFIPNTLNSDIVLMLLIVIIIFLSLISFFLVKEKWKNVLILTSLLVGVPGISFVYTAIFMIIPFIYYLNDDSISKPDVNQFKTNFYFILFCLIFLPLPFDFIFLKNDVRSYYEHYSFNTLQIGISILIMTFMIIHDGIKIIFKKTALKKSILGTIFIGFLLCITANIIHKTSIIQIKNKYEKFFKNRYSISNSNVKNDLYIFKDARVLSSIDKDITYIDISKTDLNKDSNKVIDVLEKNIKDTIMESKTFFDLININEKGMTKILSSKYSLKDRNDSFIFLENNKNKEVINIGNIIIKLLDGFALNRYSIDKSKIMIFNPYEDNLKVSINFSIHSSTGGKISLKSKNDKYDFKLNMGKNEITTVLSLNKGRNIVTFETSDSKYFDEHHMWAYNTSFVLDINSMTFENDILNKLSNIDLNEVYLISSNHEKENYPKDFEKLSINKKHLSESTLYESFLLLQKEKKNFIISKNYLSKIITTNSTFLSQCIKDNYICIADDGENLLYKYVEYPVDFIPSNIIFFYGKGFEKDSYTDKMLAKDNSELLIYNPYDTFEGILNIDGEGFGFSNGVEITNNNIKKFYKFENEKANILEQLKIPSGLTKITITKPSLVRSDSQYGTFRIDKLSVTNISKKYVIDINNIDLDNTLFTKNVLEISHLTKPIIITDTKKYIDFDPNSNIEFNNFNIHQNNDENLWLENIGIKYEPYSQNNLITLNGNGVMVSKDYKHYGSGKSEIIFYNPYSIDIQAKLMLNIDLLGNEISNCYITTNMNEKLSKYDFINGKSEIREEVVLHSGKNILYLNFYGSNDSLEINGIRYYYSYSQAGLQLDYLDYFIKNNHIDAINTQVIIEKGLTTQNLPYFNHSKDDLGKKEFWFTLFDDAIINHKNIIISKSKFSLLTSDIGKGVNKLTEYYDYMFSDNSFIYLKYKQNKDVPEQKVWMFYGNGAQSLDGNSSVFHNEKTILYIFNPYNEDRKAKIAMNIKLPYYKSKYSYKLRIQSAYPVRFPETSQENKEERYIEINKSNLDIEHEVIVGHGLNTIMIDVMTTDQILYIINDSKIDVIR